MRYLTSMIYQFLALQGLSMLGSRLTSIALGIWIVKETGNVTPLLLISLFNEVPLLIFGTWIGLFVDRWKRKTAIIVGDSGQALCTLILVLSLLTGNFELWQIYVIVAVQGLFMAIQGAAASAVMPMMAAAHELDRANSMKELLFPLAGIVAPFLAGMLYAPIGLAGIVLLDLVTFGVCITVCALLPLPELLKEEQQEEQVGSFWTDACQGYVFLWRQKSLLYLVFYFAWWNFILNGPLELAVPYFLLRTGSDSVMSWLLAVMNAGALVGAAAAVWWGEFRRKLTFIFASSILTASMFIVVGLSDDLWMMAIFLFLLMLPLAMTGALFSSLLQLRTPLSMQGRVFTAYGQLAALTAPLSFLVTGPLVDRWLEPSMTNGSWPSLNAWVGEEAGSGISLLFVICGLLLAVGVLWTLSSRSVRHLS
jgi:DHA3 family macrolide efflux protein-like MFS transporter